MINDRIRMTGLRNKIMSAEDASNLICDGMIVATSGFTPSGYPKAVPLALTKRAEALDRFSITLITGASVGDEIDGALTRSGLIKKRFPYQTHNDIRDEINSGKILFQDVHLSHLPQYLKSGFYGNIDVAIVEALAITKEGGIIPTTSVGISPTAIQLAQKVIVEINTSQPMTLEGMHDIYFQQRPPHGKPIPIMHPGDRIGTTYIPCDPNKIEAIVFTDIKDGARQFSSIDEKSFIISGYIMEFLNHEVKMGRLPKNLLPLQSGVGCVANAVLGGLVHSNFHNLTCYSEVIQDSMLDLIDSGKVIVASGSALTPSKEGYDRLYKNLEKYASFVVLRPQEISNSPEVIRRLGVIAMNTAIEIDMYGHVNSTNIMGSKMMNGIGGSGDYTRNAYLSFFSTPSTAMNGDISSIVPMVSHVDHTEHDVMIVVTEQGLADLRGTSPTERAMKIIDNCAHPDYKYMLKDYMVRASTGKNKHEPHLIEEALSWHHRFMQTGSMRFK